MTLGGGSPKRISRFARSTARAGRPPKRFSRFASPTKRAGRHPKRISRFADATARAGRHPKRFSRFTRTAAPPPRKHKKTTFTANSSKRGRTSFLLFTCPAGAGIAVARLHFVQVRAHFVIVRHVSYELHSRLMEFNVALWRMLTFICHIWIHRLCSYFASYFCK